MPGPQQVCVMLAIDGGGGVQIGKDMALDGGRIMYTIPGQRERRSFFLSESMCNLSRATLLYPAWFMCPDHGPIAMVSIDGYCD